VDELSARSVDVVANGLRLRAYVWGRDGDPTVVAVHGNGAHAHWWRPIVPALAPGWRVVAPDLRGHGESGWPAAPDYAMTDFHADLSAVIDALAPGPIALVGHSMGGRIALWWAAHAGARVRALAMLDARLEHIVPADAARYRKKAVPGERAGRGYATRAAALAAFRFVPEEPGVPPDVVAMLAERAIVERGPGDWTFRFDRGVLRFEGDAAGDLMRLLPRIVCPALVANGRASWVLDVAARERIVVALPRGRGRTFAGAHHFLLSHPDEVGRGLREFLDDAAGAAEPNENRCSKA
jgi:pimeloyl-ACP methyl ester carboxylesterase